MKNKVAIITGGNRGIGLGVAKALASAGASISIAARNTIKTAKAAESIKDHYSVDVLQLEVNVLNEGQIKKMVEKTLDRFNQVDILINNAGMNNRKYPQEYTVEEYDEILDVNLKSAFLSSNEVYPVMKRRGGGKIINIGSMTSLFGGAKLMPYGTSKGGIVAMTRAYAVAWARDNIQVNAILPGWIDTDLTRRARLEIDDLDTRVISRTPVGRWGIPDDLYGTAIYLSSGASDFVTGVSLPVDGGYSINI